MKTETLAASLTAAFGGRLGGVTVALNELTAIVPVADLVETMRGLRDRPELSFETLIDLCGVDYSAYGGEKPDILSTSSDATPPEPIIRPHPGRFAVVYHLPTTIFRSCRR
jgi:NADH-quinone oxidoreductase subunit C